MNCEWKIEFKCCGKKAVKIFDYGYPFIVCKTHAEIIEKVLKDDNHPIHYKNT